MKTTLVIADDHEILRHAIAGYVADSAGMSVVGAVGDAQGAVNACMRSRPDILLLDIEMPGRDSLSAIKDIHAVSPDTRVIMLTAYCRDAFIEAAISAGAAGYVLKSDPPAAIADAILAVAAGGSAFSGAVQARMTDRTRDRSNEPAPATRAGSLTPRELEVLRYIGRGLDTQQMANAMNLSRRTVERHVSRLMDALDIRDRLALQRFAFEQGFTS